MAKNIKSLSVRLYGKEVGILKENSGNMTFKYNDGINTALSLSMPIKSEPYKNKYCKSYFGGLLPENEEVKKAIGKKYKINDTNDFAMLSAIGRECAGAISFYSIDESEIQDIQTIKVAQWLTNDELDNKINNLPQNPMAGRRLSLAGVQTKMVVDFIDNKIGLPETGSPSTHIIKPNPQGYDGLIYNEYICMSCIKSIGIEAPNIYIHSTNTQDYLLIERFDRITNNDKILRLHQEDFTQASGVLSQNKYDFTIADCAKILEQTSVPATAKNTFIKQIIFNILIGNCDAHGKNYSIIYLPDRNIELTPAYDIVCTAIYENLDKKLAMKIGRHNIAEEISKSDWIKFAKTLDVNPNIIFEEIKNQINIIPDKITKLAEELNKEIGYKISDFVIKNCEMLQEKL